MNKWFILIVLFLLNILYCTAVDSGTIYTVWTVPKCYDEMYVQVTSENNISVNEYRLDSCTEKESNLWVCFCNSGQPYPIDVYTLNNTVNVYDFRIQYYILPKAGITEQDIMEHEMNKRIKNINNIKFAPPKKPFKFPLLESLDLTITIGIIVGIVVLVFFILAIGFRFIMGKQEREDATENILSNNEEISDEEVKNFLNNL